MSESELSPGPKSAGKESESSAKRKDREHQVLQLIQRLQNGREKVDPAGLPASFLQLGVTATILELEVDSPQDIYLQYAVRAGEDWRLQDSTKAAGTTHCSSGRLNSPLVFGQQFEVFFYTTTPFGWPRVLFTLYGYDFLGNRLVKGYATVSVPTTAGTRTVTAAAYGPSVTWFETIENALTGKSVDYRGNQKLLLKGEGRETCVVAGVGQIKVRFDIVKRNFQRLGFV